MMNQPILIVEDDSKIAKVVKVYLEGAGYRVVHADRGKDAIEAALREMPLLAVLDLMLPDTSGEEVCQELRQIGDFPIIMLTAKASEEERVAGFALGADDYIVKPFSPRELVYRIKAVLRRQQKGDLDQATPVSFNKGALIIDGQTYEVRKAEDPVKITPTEFRAERGEESAGSGFSDGVGAAHSSAADSGVGPSFGTPPWAGPRLP